MTSIAQTHRKDTLMKSKDINALDLRLAVLATTVAALARSLPSCEAARASLFISEQVNVLVGSQCLTERGEDSILGDLTRILEALQRQEAPLAAHVEAGTHADN